MILLSLGKCNMQCNICTGPRASREPVHPSVLLGQEIPREFLGGFLGGNFASLN